MDLAFGLRDSSESHYDFLFQIKLSSNCRSGHENTPAYKFITVADIISVYTCI